jgi:membrane-bound inhibitor of C-type lysozyme
LAVIGAKFYTQIYPEPIVPKNGEPPVPTGSVDITLSDGRSMHLAQTISGSGARYANSDESFIFWSKGTSAIVLENNEEKTFIDCEEKTGAATATSTKKFLYDNQNFSIILPRYTIPPEVTQTDSYTVDESHTYGLIPGETITGVKFTIPSSLTTGTNLSKDTYLSVEHIANAKKCTADMFLEGDAPISKLTEKGINYTVASSTGAGAGNRYEEIVYATADKHTCTAVRYYIHYSAIENYPPGTKKQFNKDALLEAFAKIRSTLTVK